MSKTRRFHQVSAHYKDSRRFRVLNALDKCCLDIKQPPCERWKEKDARRVRVGRLGVLWSADLRLSYVGSSFPFYHVFSRV